MTTNIFTFEQNNCGANLITNIYFRICPEVQVEDEDKFIKYFRISRSDQFATENELEWSDWMIYENKDSINNLDYICNTDFIRIQFKGIYDSNIEYEIKCVIIKFDKNIAPINTSFNIFTESFGELVSDYSENLNNLVSDTMTNYYTQNVLYIKANTNIENNSDPFLLEWNLLQYECPKVVKALFSPDEEIDTDWRVNPFGMNFQSSIAINIQIKHFQDIFGNASRPQAHDMIYIKKLNRMYEVTSSDIVRGVNYKPMYFKITLNQAEKREYIETTPIQEFYDNVIEANSLSIEKLFGKTNEKEMISTTDDMQLKNRTTQTKEIYRRNNTVTKHHINKNYSYKNILVIQNLFNNGTKISTAHYDFSNVEESLDILEYNTTKNIESNFTYSCWFNISDPIIEKLEVTKYTINNDKLILNVKPFNIKNIKNYLCIYNSNEFDYVKIINYNRSKREFECSLPQTNILENDLSTLNFLTFNKINFIKSDKLSIYYIPSYGFEIILNDIQNIFKCNIEYNKWLALVVNYAPTLTNTLKVKIYNPDLDEKLNVYAKEFEKPVNCILENQMDEINNYIIESSPYMKMTNIKLLTKNIDDQELLNKVINSFVIQDSENYIILDNCNIPIENSYIGKVL